MSDQKIDKGHVIRVSVDCYDALKRLKGKASYTAAIEALIDARETLLDADRVLSGRKAYRVRDRVFDDVADARGYALVLQVRSADEKAMRAEVLVKVGEDGNV